MTKARDLSSITNPNSLPGSSLTEDSIVSSKIANLTLLNEDVSPDAGISSDKLSYSRPGTTEVRPVSSRLSDGMINVRDFGAKGNGTDNDSPAVQAAIDYAMLNNNAIYFPAGEYLLSDKIEALTNASNKAGVLTLVGDDASAGRHYTMPSKIIFDDDGTTTGKIGLETAYSICFRNLYFTTFGGDCRGKSGDFIGILAPGGSMKINNCFFLSCSGAALKVRDIGYASMYDCIFRYNKVGLLHYLVNWPFGTTGDFTRVHAFQNITVFEVPALNHSTWRSCIWEYNGRGCNGFSNGCEFIGNYAEQNGEYAAIGNTSGAVLISNYSNGPGDQWVATSTPFFYGFDAIGTTFIGATSSRFKQIQFYDRSGNQSEILKASNAGYSNLLAIEDSDGEIMGIVPKRLANQNSGQADRTVMFMLFGNNVKGAPAGWTITNVSTGVWEVRWPDPATGNTRWPYIFTQGVPTAGNSATRVVTTIHARDTVGVWAAFQSMSVGFDIRIHTVDPATGIMTLSDQGAMVQVSW